MTLPYTSNETAANITDNDNLRFDYISDNVTYSYNFSNDAANQLNSNFAYYTEQTASFLNIYYIPVLIVVGVIGNIITIIVFSRGKLRVQSTSQYLTALALTDTVFLLQLIVPWLNTVQLTGIFHHSEYCKVFVYISYTCSCQSAWLVVGFTVERFVAVTYPLQRNIICSVHRARILVLIIFIGSITVNIPVLRFASSDHEDCNINKKFLEEAGHFNLFDTAFTFTVPLIIILTANSRTISGMVKFERFRNLYWHTPVHETPRRRPLEGAAVSLAPNTRNHGRVTRMLIIVSTVFIGFNVPAFTMRMIAYANVQLTNSPVWSGLQQIAIILFNTNYGINFILYCLTGKNFRLALKETFWMGRRSPPERQVVTQRRQNYRQTRGSSMSTSGASNLTEATGAGAIAPDNTRRNRSRSISRGREGGEVICRWTFDNSRQRERQRAAQAAHEAIEMQEVSMLPHQL